MSIEETPSLGSLRIDSQTQRRIEECARGEGVTPSELIRKAFEEYEAGHDRSRPTSEGGESALEFFQRAGLIGCVKVSPGTPRDLSTNPDHMQGFGGE